LETLDKLIVEENYLPEHIFNMDESSLFWKRMPEMTSINNNNNNNNNNNLHGYTVHQTMLKPFITN